MLGIKCLNVKKIIQTKCKVRKIRRIGFACFRLEQRWKETLQHHAFGCWSPVMSSWTKKEWKNDAWIWDVKRGGIEAVVGLFDGGGNYTKHTVHMVCTLYSLGYRVCVCCVTNLCVLQWVMERRADLLDWTTCPLHSKPIRETRKHALNTHVTNAHVTVLHGMVIS